MPGDLHAGIEQVWRVLIKKEWGIWSRVVLLPAQRARGAALRFRPHRMRSSDPMRGAQKHPTRARTPSACGRPGTLEIVYELLESLGDAFMTSNRRRAFRNGRQGRPVLSEQGLPPHEPIAASQGKVRSGSHRPLMQPERGGLERTNALPTAQVNSPTTVCCSLVTQHAPPTKRARTTHPPKRSTNQIREAFSSCVSVDSPAR